MFGVWRSAFSGRRGSGVLLRQVSIVDRLNFAALVFFHILECWRSSDWRRPHLNPLPEGEERKRSRAGARVAVDFSVDIASGASGRLKIFEAAVAGF